MDQWKNFFPFHFSLWGHKRYSVISFNILIYKRMPIHFSFLTPTPPPFFFAIFFVLHRMDMNCTPFCNDWHLHGWRWVIAKFLSSLGSCIFRIFSVWFESMGYIFDGWSSHYFIPLGSGILVHHRASRFVFTQSTMRMACLSDSDSWFLQVEQLKKKETQI